MNAIRLQRILENHLGCDFKIKSDFYDDYDRHTFIVVVRKESEDEARERVIKGMISGLFSSEEQVSIIIKNDTGFNIER